MLLNFIFSVFLSSFIFWIFKVNKTSYILGYSMLVFVLSFIYFLHIGFEFIALIFMITYIGGIAVMFLFLILVLDVNKENTKPSKLFNYSSLLLIIIVISLANTASKLIFNNYNPFLFNNFQFYEVFLERLFNNVESSINLSENMDFFNEHYEFYDFFTKYHAYPQFSIINYDDIYAPIPQSVLRYLRHFVFNLFFHQDLSKFFFETNLENNFSKNFWNSHTLNFSDVVAIGIFSFAYHGVLLVLIAIYLLVVLIASIYIGSGMFQVEKL